VVARYEVLIREGGELKVLAELESEADARTLARLHSRTVRTPLIIAAYTDAGSREELCVYADGAIVNI
jgi:hypothetical protein